MVVQVSSSDPRSLKALDILQTAEQWTKGHRKSDGAAFFVIPSSSGSRLYWTNTRECTCPDAIQRGVTCKHQFAVRLWLARHQGEQASTLKARECVTCSRHVRPESIYATCENDTDMAHPILALR